MVQVVVPRVGPPLLLLGAPLGARTILLLYAVHICSQATLFTCGEGRQVLEL